MDKFWEELEWDFQNLLGIRAMEWFEGKRDWREFYRLKQRFGVGSATHTAMTNDPETAEQIAEQLRKNRGKPRQPLSPEGFDPLMHKLTDLQDMLIVVAASQAGDTSSIQWSERPKYLYEEIADFKSRAKARRLAHMLVPHDVTEDDLLD